MISVTSQSHFALWKRICGGPRFGPLVQNFRIWAEMKSYGHNHTVKSTVRKNFLSEHAYGCFRSSRKVKVKMCIKIRHSLYHATWNSADFGMYVDVISLSINCNNIRIKIITFTMTKCYIKGKISIFSQISSYSAKFYEMQCLFSISIIVDDRRCIADWYVSSISLCNISNPITDCVCNAMVRFLLYGCFCIMCTAVSEHSGKFCTAVSVFRLWHWWPSAVVIAICRAQSLPILYIICLWPQGSYNQDTTCRVIGTDGMLWLQRNYLRYHSRKCQGRGKRNYHYWWSSDCQTMYWRAGRCRYRFQRRYCEYWVTFEPWR